MKCRCATIMGCRCRLPFSSDGATRPSLAGQTPKVKITLNFPKNWVPFDVHLITVTGDEGAFDMPAF